MENRIMRKHLIGTILVLAALAACNKEIDTQTPAIVDPVEETPAGKVTLTFKATIGEETRTTYANDKTASWAAGDKISVRVTDGTNFETAEFSTTDGETFTGQVTNGYTTIVSGVYPANDNHVFSGGSVQSVYLPDTYNLGTANDGGIALPMVGEMKKKDGVDTFTFHHICGALKIEIVDIFNALTFTTAGETITGGFELDEETGRIKMPENGTSSTVTFNYGRLSTNPTVGERKNRTFYIPVPDGTLTAGATMALKNSSDKVVFEKTTSGNIAFDSKVIKRLPAIVLQTPDGWGISVTEGTSSSETGKYVFTVPSGANFFYTATSKSSFESDYHGSVADFIEQKALTNTIYTSSGYKAMKYTMDYYYGQEYIILICGITRVDGNRRITFDYCLLDYQFPTEDYLKWIGKWTVSDGTNDDTWTITRKQVNQTYTITGIAGRTSNHVTADFNNGELSLSSQLLPEKYGSKDFYLLTRGPKGGCYTSVNRHIMSMSLTDGNTAVVSPDMTNSAGGYGFYTHTPDSDSYPYVVRRSFGSDITITMTRVTPTE